jgi:hypothetical protein
MGGNNQRHAYLVHPNEWMVWLLMFCVFSSARLTYHFLVTPQTQQHMEGSFDASEVFRRLRFSCRHETEMFCGGGRWNFNETCTTAVWGIPFGSILEIKDQFSPDSPLSGLNCSLLAHSSVQEGLTLEEQEKRAVVEKMTTILRTLLHGLVLSEKDFGLRWQFTVDLYILKLYCLFAYKGDPMTRWKAPGQPPAWNTIIMSDSSLWTAEIFFDLLTEAKENIKSEMPLSYEDIKRIKNSTLQMRDDDWLHRESVTGHRRSKADANVQAVRLLSYMEVAKNLLQQQVSLDPDAGCPSYPAMMPEGNYVKTSHLLFFPFELHHCMNTHSLQRRQSILSLFCMEAMKDAPAELDELQMEDYGGFASVSFVLLWGVNLPACFMLLSLLTAKRRFEKKLDRSRNYLQQELNDPVLRHSLENKAGDISEEDRRSLISRLEAKIANWDSKAGALKRLRLNIRRFRLLLIFTMVLTTVVHVPLLIFAYSSMPEYLEIVAMSTAMLAISYCAPTEDAANHEPQSRMPKNLEMDTFDQSTTQPSLSPEMASAET